MLGNEKFRKQGSSGQDRRREGKTGEIHPDDGAGKRASGTAGEIIKCAKARKIKTARMAEPTCRLDRFAKQGEQKAEKLV